MTPTNSGTPRDSDVQADTDSTSEELDNIELPSDVEEILFSKFDDLVRKGDILWSENTNELVRDGSFEATFQLAPHLMKKPIQHASDPSRKTGKGGSRNPFLDPEKSFIASPVGSRHTLLLNKYPVYRPSAILHTNVFRQQSDHLDIHDLNAAYSLLKRLERSDDDQILPNTSTKSTTIAKKEPKWLLIYNCGVNSGSSQGHKHMQLWPYLKKSDVGFEMFFHRLVSQHKSSSVPTTSKSPPPPPPPQHQDQNQDGYLQQEQQATNPHPEANTNKDKILTDPNLPHLQFTLPLHSLHPHDPDHQNTPKTLHKTYTRLLRAVQSAHKTHASSNPSTPAIHPAYNVALTVDSLTLIPRRYSGIEYKAGSNTAGMLGLIWIGDEMEKGIWMGGAKGSLGGYVSWLGLPNDVALRNGDVDVDVDGVAGGGDGDGTHGMDV